MNKLFTTWLMLAALTLNVVDSQAEHSAQTDDQVVASFEREFDHETAPAQDVRRDEIDEDVLYELISKSLQSKESDIEAEDMLVAGAEQ